SLPVEYGSYLLEFIETCEEPNANEALRVCKVKDDLRVKSDGARKQKDKGVKEEQSFKRMEARLRAMMIVRLYQVQRKMRLSLYLRSEGFTENDSWDRVTFWDIE
ncbi:hypothetical protein Tco_1442905, partial [Tanacetum coccineum]